MYAPKAKIKLYIERIPAEILSLVGSKQAPENTSNPVTQVEQASQALQAVQVSGQLVQTLVLPEDLSYYPTGHVQAELFMTHPSLQVKAPAELQVTTPIPQYTQSLSEVT